MSKMPLASTKGVAYDVAASLRRPAKRNKSPKNLYRREFGGLLPLINDWRFHALDNKFELRVAVVVALVEDLESMLCGLGETEESREVACVGEEWVDMDARLLSNDPLGESMRIVSSGG